MGLTKKQLEARRNFIGSSEAKIIASADLEKWHELILQKKAAEPIVFNRTIQRKMDWGSYSESFVLDEWSTDSDIEIGSFQLGRDRIHESKGVKVPIHSTYDALTVEEPWNPVEAKCHFGMMNIDDIADMYSPQCQHHIYTSMTQGCYLAVLFGLNARLEWRWIRKDEEWISAYLHNAKQFWQWYTDGIEPKGYEPMMSPDWTNFYTMELDDLESWDETLNKQVSMNVQSVLTEKEAKEDANKAKIELRHLMPRNCRKMTHELDGNLKGHKLEMIRIKGREPSIKITKTKQPE